MSNSPVKFIGGAIARAAAGGKSRNIGGILGGLSASRIAGVIARRQKNKNKTQNIAAQGMLGQRGAIRSIGRPSAVGSITGSEEVADVIPNELASSSVADESIDPNITQIQDELTNVTPQPSSLVQPFSEPAQQSANQIFGDLFARQNAIGAPMMFKINK